MNAKDSVTFRDEITPFLAKPFISKMCATSSRPDSLMPPPYHVVLDGQSIVIENLLCAGHTFFLIALHRDECFFKVEGFG